VMEIAKERFDPLLKMNRKTPCEPERFVNSLGEGIESEFSVSDSERRDADFPSNFEQRITV
ncbi:hypothetical protein J6590_103802, partial [Homalodisca vitripennis]